MPTALFHTHRSLQKKKTNKQRKLFNIHFTNERVGTKQLDALLKDKQETHGNVND